MDKDMMKELGKYFIDLSKYIVTSVLISTFFSNSGNALYLIWIAIMIAALFLIWGLGFMKTGKKGTKK